MAEPSLAGSRILIVEDDFLLAYCTEKNLRTVGAQIVGPFSTEADAIRVINRGDVSAAVIDVNLGSGPTFGTARALRSSGVPFILLTGYDCGSRPAEFVDVPPIMQGARPNLLDALDGP